MKRIKPLFFVWIATTAFLFTACKKTPPLDNLSNDFVVLTKYDTASAFASFKTFAIRDTIAVSTENPKDSFWYDTNARAIIGEVAAKMTAAGYFRVATGGASVADLGIQLIGIRNTTLYDVSPGYWWGLPGYATPCYWGNCNGWPYWYPYWYSYSVTTGSLIIEMADLKDAPKNRKLNIVWNGIGSGQIGNSNSFAIAQCIKSVDQAFAQSPYLKAALK
jgi:hypothetical protein